MKHLFLAAAAALAMPRRAPAATVVTADRMLDVVNGRYVDHPAILIGDDGHIQQIGSAASMQLPAGTKHIDLPGETLLPGLIDMHVHLTSLAEIGGYQGLKYTDSFWRRSESPMRKPRSTPASPRCATSARATSTTSASSRRSTAAGSRGRGSSPPPMRSAPPAAIATTPACRPITTRRGRR